MNLRLAYTFSLLCLATGVVLSIAHDQWDWLARAGSLIVVAGILLTSSEILTQLRALRHHRRYGEGWAQHDWASEAGRGNHENQEQTHSHGFYLLVIGTLIWGFGDLVGLFF